MAISNFDNASVSTNVASDFVALRPGENLIGVTSTTWAASTAAALQFSYDGTTPKAGALDENGLDTIFTANRYRSILGPGYVRIVVTNISAAIELKRVSPS